MKLSINVGFITNSSSAIYHFPRELLEHEDIKAVLDAYGVSGGFVSDDVWNRARCDTFAITRKQKLDLERKMKSESELCPDINTEDDSIVVVFGDEYSEIASVLCSALRRASKDFGGSDGKITRAEFN